MMALPLVTLGSTSRIAKAASAMCRLSNPLFRKHRISIRTKINRYRSLVVSVLLYGSEAWATHHPRRSPPPRRVRHALSNAPPACVLAAAHQQPKHPRTHQATNSIIPPTTTPPALVRISPPHNNNNNNNYNKTLFIHRQIRDCCPVHGCVHKK